MSEEVISVRGARVHNLKTSASIIPLNKLTVVTGVSGSGKIQLAFDTFMRKGNGVTSKASRLTPGSFSNAWTSPMWTRS